MATVLEFVIIPRSYATPSSAMSSITTSSVCVISGRRNSFKLSEFRGLKIRPVSVTRSLGSVSSRVARRSGGIVCETQETAVEVSEVEIWKEGKSMEDSQSDSSIFSVQIVPIDYYLAPPIPDIDIVIVVSKEEL